MRDIPLCYHPSTIIIVDDNSEYLKQLAFRLNSYPYTIKTFESGYNFLEYINLYYIPEHWTQKIINQDINISNTYQQWAINLELYKLPLEIYNDNRFKQVSCIIMDYSMPGPNGLDIFEKIKHPHIKRILLTGVADEQIGIDAFNKGIIDSYIVKSDKDILDKLSVSINKLSAQYFSSLSRTAADIVIYNNQFSCLLEPGFKNLFERILLKYNIVEFYLFESFGCYIMLDAKGKAYGFFIYPKQDVREVLADTNISSNWAKFFNNEPYIMCYHKMIEPVFPTGIDKKQYLIPAEYFAGAFNEFYFAVTDKNLDINNKKILSIDNYKTVNRT